MKKTMLSTKQSYLVCFIGILAAFGIVTVSYTHLTLPTNSLV